MNESARRSQSPRAIYSREWRVNNREKKRFNTLLSGYISVKYHCIYNEYGEFYNSLNQVHPEVRDLTKTATFKKWKKDQQSNEADEQESEQQQTDLPGQVDDQESEQQQQQQQQIDLPGQVDDQESEQQQQQQIDLPGQVDDQESEQQQQQQIDLPGQVDDQESEQQQQQIDLPGQVDEQESELDILSLAAEEILPIDPVNVNEVDNIINEIISDLEQDNAMQDI